MPKVSGSHGPKPLTPRNRAAEWEWCVWPDCDSERDPAPDAPPLCTNHLITCAHHMAQRIRMSLLDPDREMWNRRRAEIIAERARGASVVYYVRINDHVKIGTTTNLAKRVASFHLADSSAVLATEPGDRELEKMRHSEFAAERAFHNRELFNPSPRLLAHIDRLKTEADRLAS